MLTKQKNEIEELLHDFETVSPGLTEIIVFLRKIVLSFSPAIKEEIKYGGIVFIEHKQLICGIFLFETLSVIIQVGYYKYTRNNLGKGKRLFLMSPIHHHFQKLGYHESKIAVRFWIIGILLAILSLITLKIR